MYHGKEPFNIYINTIEYLHRSSNPHLNQTIDYKNEITFSIEGTENTSEFDVEELMTKRRPANQLRMQLRQLKFSQWCDSQIYYYKHLH